MFTQRGLLSPTGWQELWGVMASAGAMWPTSLRCENPKPTIEESYVWPSTRCKVTNKARTH